MPQDTKQKIDLGFIVRQKMDEQGTTVAWLARRVNCDRGNLHKQLNNIHIHPELLLKISAALKTNFFAHYFKYCEQLIENELNKLL